MQKQTEIVKEPESWLAFELNVLRRLDFKSIALASDARPVLGARLKEWGVRVFSNNILPSAHFDSLALIQNSGTCLTGDDIDGILEDAYVPRFELKNPALAEWFGETDAWWFDNVSTNIEQLDDPLKTALAASLVFKVGDYALSFDDQTRRLRQAFSVVFRRVLALQPNAIDNQHENTSENKNIKEFIAENYTDLLFLRLPKPRSISLKRSLGERAWKEEWVAGGKNVWESLEEKIAGTLGTHVETKSQYINLLDDLLRTASHIPNWIFIHTEDHFISTQDVVESIGKLRRVETIYTKDFTEIMGTKAVIITA